MLNDDARDPSIASNAERKGWHRNVVLTVVAVCDLTLFMGFSLMAPFFPREADIKNVSTTVSGFIFSTFSIVMMLSSPMFGKIMPYVGIKRMMMAGICVAGVFNILFGMLDKINDTTTFIVLCFLVRAAVAFGTGTSDDWLHPSPHYICTSLTAAFLTAAAAYVMKLFQDAITMAFSYVEIFVGVALSIGPALGGFLYGLGGYELPFLVIGVLILANLIPCYFLHPHKHGELEKG